MSHTTIDYDPKKGKFIINTPPWNNGRVRDIPSRRFDEKNKKWTAPATRINVTYLEMSFRDADWSKLALEKLAEVKNAVANIIAPALPWPTWYKFKTEPMRTQKIALERAFGRHAFAFFKDMGTGKSKTYIDLAAASRQMGLIEAAGMICPVALRKNWVRELEKHCPIPYDVHILDSGDEKGFEKWLKTPHDYKFLIVGVESIGQSKKAFEMMLAFAMRYPKSMLGVDEATKIKNHGAIRSQRCADIARYVAHKIVMTGTPIAKGIMDLYGYFEYLDPDILGTGDFYAFRNRYAVMGGFEQKEIIGYQNMDELMETIAPFIYQVRKEEALPDLPPKVRTMRYVTLSPDQVKHYKTMVKDQAVWHDDGRSKTVVNTLEKALRLRQITSNFIALEDMEPDFLTGKRLMRTEPIAKTNPKIADLLDFLDEFHGQMIIWCAFRPELEEVARTLRERFGQDQVVELHGGIPEAQRDYEVNEDFQNGRKRFVAGMASVGGMGLTMTAAECVFYMSNTHSFIDREQSEDRPHRKGLKHSVLYVDQIAQIETAKGHMADTVDMLVYQSNVEKKNLSEYVKDEIDRMEREGHRDLAALFGLT